MMMPGAGFPPWTMVDEGWGRKAVDFATLSEPGNCREYVAVQHRLGVDAGDRLLDVACGSGLAIELARLRGVSAEAPCENVHKASQRKRFNPCVRLAPAQAVARCPSGITETFVPNDL